MELFGVAPGNVQVHALGILVDVSVKVTDCPTQIVVAEAVKLATGGSVGQIGAVLSIVKPSPLPPK